LLSGIETHKEKVLRIILAGQPELKETLDSPSLKQLVQRVRLRFHLGSLDSREMREYIEHRLKIAGCENRQLFDDDTFETLHRYTGGVPRLINTLCDSALLCAFADEKTNVDLDSVMAAIAELDWQEHESVTGIHEKLRQIEGRRPRDAHVTRIEVRYDGDVVEELSFPAGRIIVGRSPDNEIYIKSKFVSRHHAQLVSDDDGCVIEDLNSTNGVFLGEKQIKKYRLRDGDIVSLGVHELVYHDLRVGDETLDDQLDEIADEQEDMDDVEGVVDEQETA
jgi:general secretion pathway protein A